MRILNKYQYCRNTINLYFSNPPPPPQTNCLDKIDCPVVRVTGANSHDGEYRFDPESSGSFPQYHHVKLPRTLWHWNKWSINYRNGGNFLRAAGETTVFSVRKSLE